MIEGSYTGNYYFAKTRKGMVLMVEVHYIHTDSIGGHIDSTFRKCYRKATEKDIPHLKVILNNGEEENLDT